MNVKYLYIVLLFLIFLTCKNEKREESNIDHNLKEDTNPIVKDTIKIKDLDIESLNKSITIELKQKQFIAKKDESEELVELIIDKKYLVDKKDYTINFKYPLLNESYKPTNSNFNEFINDYYINITQTESDILENKLLCDSITAKKIREERFIDYKIYNVNDQLVSVLFYKENFYNGAMHPSFSFDCFNFDLNRGTFMTYEDFFSQGSEEELVSIINESINSQIGKGDMYYDCWEVSSDDFFTSKNNFVLNDTYIEFYFDDCVICPSYTGTYSIEIPLTDLLSVLKKYESNPLVF
ncbi:Protein of unknown function [Winogradskyella thalassocola]|uniref:DUF3298 domain-containing protein n=1 Tax=Winogradskyella thalassocola TaxID=262004 RepID=A0A1G8JCU4_9FLAO|nr:Protein of unknown function [Winogradskyella thalassocola]